MSLALLSPHTAAHILDTPLFLSAHHTSAFMAAVTGQMIGAETAEGGQVVRASLQAPLFGLVGDRFGRALDARGVRPYDMVGPVAVVSVEGALINKGAFVGSGYGVTSYQGITTVAQRIAQDPTVKGAVFEIDSYGGTMSGSMEAAAALADLSDRMPTMAILTEAALSAGYLMATPARQIVAPATGLAGSIGAVILHADVSEMLGKAGVKITQFHSGARKVDGSPVAPLSDEASASMQARVDAGRKMFADAVGAYRGQRLTADAAMATEAQVYDAQDALSAGLIDAVGSPAEAFAAFVRAVS